MSTLPPGAPGAPNPPGNEPGADAPRWAAPAVPPPWPGAGQEPAPATPPSTPPAWASQAPQGPEPQPQQAPPWAQPQQAPPWTQPQGQPAWGPPAYAPAPPAARFTFDRQKWLPTLAVAAVIAGVVLGGIGLDKVVAAPSVGTVSLGGGATMEAAPGWAQVDTGSSGVTLQKGNVRVFAAAEAYDGSAEALLREVESSIRDEADQVTFGSEQTGSLSGHEAAIVGFEAIISGSAGATLDGEAICLIVGPDGVLIEAIAPVGMLDSAAPDIKAMASSVEVGQ
jgi:hypothetical protein